MEQEKRGRGRPTKYQIEYADQAYKLALLGATDIDLAGFFEVDETTVNEWKRKHSEFSLSIKKGKQIADSNVASRLYNRAMGYEHTAVKIFQYEGSPLEVPYIEKYPPDTTAAIFWLKNRQPALWRDKQEIEHKHDVRITLDDLAAERRALEDRREAIANRQRELEARMPVKPIKLVSGGS